MNRNPENYFLDVEQAAFAPTNIVPGLDYSPDKMLQGRLFSYGDAQRYRLGVNHWQIPVNQPKGVGVENLCPFSRDGQMRFLDNNQGGGPHYYPNNQGIYESQPEHRSHHSRQMVMVMNIIIARMMTITLNSQVNYSDYSPKMQKSVSSQIQLMQWMGSLKMSKFAHSPLL